MSEDRIALVVGGARGVGRGITDALVATGVQVAVATRDQPEELPSGARWFGADVREPDGATALVAAVVEHHGRLDVLVNSAGGSPAASTSTSAPSFTSAILTINLLGPLHVAVAANEVMQGQDTGGAIVNLATLGAMRAAPGTAAYAAAKAGLLSLTQSLAVEWAPKVRVNAVSYDLADESVPVGRAGTPADVAAAVVHLASPGAGYVSGANLVVHGGGQRPAYLAALAG
jgi:NAD(P)-dependent dehydrogenase (short-subunit alcohol dehydrogenase family)